ncbi:hypothetical protein DL762_001100 [Monosporascus cannonballus]|uniref:Uncharacterized protein n=1 Tax=Monosporascus cannonballus TaxID=155416 RepID=A0ABY0HHV2_9PEZI|nr:hypothetical protein DL762_001100 [Monosporascus cannonballus]
MALFGMVSSNSPNFNPGPEDLERTCVQTCAVSLESWVENVRVVCTQPGDGALISSSVRLRPQVPVATFGEVFQYHSGWCALNYPMSGEWARDDFTCCKGCAEQFFTLAHDLPGSQYQFPIYELADNSHPPPPFRSSLDTCAHKSNTMAAAANGTRSVETMTRELASTVKILPPNSWHTALIRPYRPPAFRQKRPVSGGATELRDLPGL